MFPRSARESRCSIAKWHSKRGSKLIGRRLASRIHVAGLSDRSDERVEAAASRRKERRALFFLCVPSNSTLGENGRLIMPVRAAEFWTRSSAGDHVDRHDFGVAASHCEYGNDVFQKVWMCGQDRVVYVSAGR
jgi:hypothetical protein